MTCTWLDLVLASGNTSHRTDRWCAVATGIAHTHVEKIDICGAFWMRQRLTRAFVLPVWLCLFQILENLKVDHLPPEESNPHVLRVGWSLDSCSTQLGEWGWWKGWCRGCSQWIQAFGLPNGNCISSLLSTQYWPDIPQLVYFYTMWHITTPRFSLISIVDVQL